MAEPVTVEVDVEADAGYVAVRPGTVVRSEEVSSGVVADFDAEGRLIGVEVLRLAGRVGPADPASYLRGLAEGLGMRLAAAA